MRLGDDIRLYARLLREARPFRRHIAGMFALGMFATPIALLTPMPLKIAVDSVVGSKPVPGFLKAILPGFATDSRTATLLFAALLLVFVELLSQLQQAGSAVLGTYTGERLLMSFRETLFRHCQRLSLAYHDEKGTADSVYRIQYDAPAIQWISVYGITPFLSAAVTLAGMVFVTARIDWKLALVALTIAPVLILLTRFYRGRLRAGWKQAKHMESSALGVIQEVLTSLRVVKAFGQEEREQERFVTRAGEGMRARIRVAVEQGTFSLLIGLTTAIGTAVVLYVGIRHVQEGRLTLGSLLLVMSYLTQLYVPLQAITSSVASLQASLEGAERVFSVLDRTPDVRERPHALPLERARGDIELRDVRFSYDGRRDVLTDISLLVPAGTRVGIAGRTGAGKTTLVNLLTRFYDVTEGTIFLDGHDLADYRLADLRNQFAIVLQDPVLFSTTIAENIAYGRTDASASEVVAAAEAANAHDFVSALPDGYETLVGERGMRLSGGERQRISLARAFLKDAPILILDEPTSSVDTHTEALILDAMQRLMDGRTTFMIAHRLSTLDHCDLRLELEDGRIVSAGAQLVSSV